MRLACRVCGHDGDAETLAVREMMFGSREPFDYARCAACGCLQIVRIPDDLGRHYPDGYYSFAGHDARRGWRAWLLAARNRHHAGDHNVLGALVARLRPYSALRAAGALGLPRDARIVDVGCGSGELLRTLHATGFTRLLGVDPFIDADIDADGVRIVRAELDAIGGEHDLVMFHHSLEHVADPLAMLVAARRLLAADGVCLVRIPTVTSHAFEHYGADWSALDAPRHLHLHSHRSIGILAERAGLRLRTLYSDSTAFQFWGSEQYRRGIPLMRPGSHAIAPAPGVFTAGELRGFARRARQLNAANRGDEICCVLRPPAA